jgi:flagellar motor component MotA
VEILIIIRVLLLALLPQTNLQQVKQLPRDIKIIKQDKQRFLLEMLQDWEHPLLFKEV